MAYNISSSAGNRLASSDGAFWTSTGTGTVFLKCNPNWSNADSTDHVLFNNGYQNATTFRFFRMQKFQDNNVYMGWNDQGGGDFRVSVAASSGMFTSGVWTNHTLIWSTSTGTVYYADNVNKGSAAGFTMPDLTLQTTPAREDFGNAFISAAYGSASVLSGALAEYARWNRILTSDELATLQNGYSPLVVISGLMEYRPLADYSGPRYASTTAIDVSVNASSTTGAFLTTHPVVANPPASGLLGVGL